MTKGSASRQVVFALVVAFVIMALSSDTLAKRAARIGDINVARRKQT